MVQSRLQSQTKTLALTPDISRHLPTPVSGQYHKSLLHGAKLMVAWIVLTCSESVHFSPLNGEGSIWFNCETLANQTSASKCRRAHTHSVHSGTSVQAYRMGKVSKAFRRFGFKFEMSDKFAHFSNVLNTCTCPAHLHRRNLANTSARELR